MSFAHVTKQGLTITHQSVAQNLAAASKGHTAQSAQNCTVTGRPQISPASAKPSPSGTTTEVTVIWQGGLEDETAKASLRKRHPGDIIREARTLAAQRTCHAPNILMGQWSTTHTSTGNFVYILAGQVTPTVITSLNDILCGLLDNKGWVVPTAGWQWAQL
jgi:hypothetical protein